MQNAKKWIIVYSDYKPTMRHAVDELQKEFSTRLGYAVPIKDINKLTSEDNHNYSVAFVGEKDSNKVFADILVPDNDEGYTFKVTPILDNGTQNIYITGKKPVGVLYGVMDFINEYLSHHMYTTRNYRVTDARFFSIINIEGLPKYEKSSSPSVKERGLWTWGHVIYDYKAYLKNMARLRFNVIIIWNDRVPKNGKEIVAFAHELGIKVIWGYSWGWDNDGSHPELTEENAITWGKKALSIYETQYLPTGADGIYFQTFTETDDENVDGLRISEIVTKWVNTLATPLYEKYPNLRIQFGLHANSVKNYVEDISKVNDKMEIVWENCGCFPFTYFPDEIDGLKETLEFTKKISCLRGKNDKFGVVTKSMCLLDWNTFVHPYDEFVLGESDANVVEEKAKEKEKTWKFFQTYWLDNADVAYSVIKNMAFVKGGNLLMTSLVEDGLFEKHVYFPVALYSAMLWDTNSTAKELIKQVCKWDITYFANR